MNAERMVRAFIAIPLAEGVKQRLIELQRELRPQVQGEARWLRPESTHLTLRFLGDVPEDSLEKFGAVVLSVNDSRAPFALRLRGVGAFPDGLRPQVLWIGLDETQPLLTLQTALESRLRALGLEPEERAFSPHLTLARLSRSRDLRPLLEHYSDFDGGLLPVERVILYESRLRPGGAVHLPRTVAELAGNQRF